MLAGAGWLLDELDVLDLSSGVLWAGVLIAVGAFTLYWELRGQQRW